ncbi:hypothetical protein [Moorena sp. SIO3H5]|nr:hypothetical protein [Moorena sp. SIO3H5]NEO71713.1 hypothetical protein [Moorena sp. SIO3H5]
MLNNGIIKEFCGMGILVERASWWNGHLARYQYFRAGRMSTPLLFIP